MIAAAWQHISSLPEWVYRRWLGWRRFQVQVIGTKNGRSRVQWSGSWPNYNNPLRVRLIYRRGRVMSGQHRWRHDGMMHLALTENIAANRVPAPWHWGHVTLGITSSQDRVSYVNGRVESDVVVSLNVTPVWPSTYRPELVNALGEVQLLELTGEQLEGLALHVANGGQLELVPVRPGEVLDLREDE